MTKVLYFHSDKEAELINAELKDGMIDVKEKTFIPGNEFILLRNKILNKTITEPLYILKWDCLYSGNVQTNSEDKINKVTKSIVCPVCKSDINFSSNVKERNIISTVTFTKDLNQTPESLYKTLRLKMLGGMLKIRKEFKLLPLIVGLIVGVIIIYILMYLKLIPIR